MKNNQRPETRNQKPETSIQKPETSIQKPATSLECGCDEAGRGCLAGPVVAAAVILNEGFFDPGLNDSKQLSEKERRRLRRVIESEALAWAVAVVGQETVDEINILNASILAMHQAIDQLTVKPSILLIDGHRFKPYPGVPHRCEIKGDGRFMSIAAASVLAKTHRDEYMQKIHTEHPHYGWNQNKGYPTLQHRQAIQQYGITSHHRKSFRLTDGQLKLEM